MPAGGEGRWSVRNYGLKQYGERRVNTHMHGDDLSSSKEKHLFDRQRARPVHAAATLCHSCRCRHAPVLVSWELGSPSQSCLSRFRPVPTHRYGFPRHAFTSHCETPIQMSASCKHCRRFSRIPRIRHRFRRTTPRRPF